MTISEAIRQVRKQYIAEGRAASYYAINDGLCDQLAYDVIVMLGGYTEQLCEYGGENFMTGIEGDPSENDIWDWKLLKKHWSILPPEGLSKAEVDGIAFGGHVWISDGQLHYDAECPEGVKSFFELPLYRRYIVQALREKGMSADEVVTDDLVPAPLCPIPNPVVKKPQRRASLGMRPYS